MLSNQTHLLWKRGKQGNDSFYGLKLYLRAFSHVPSVYWNQITKSIPSAQITSEACLQRKLYSKMAVKTPELSHVCF